MRLALWVVVALAIAALAVVAALGFVDRGETRRDVVATYLMQLNRVEAGLSVELARVERAYRSFGSTPAALAAQQPELARAERTTARLERQVAALRPPEEARRLHALFLDLVARQAGIAAEVAGFARYFPAFASATTPLQPAIARLGRAVSAAESGDEQARAFEAYAAVVRRVAARVKALEPPATFGAMQRAQVEQLRRVAALSARAATALRDDRAQDSARTIERLAAELTATSVVQAQREAAQGYNRRLRGIGRVVQLIDRERNRLDRELR